jgi:hypothetical protein
MSTPWLIAAALSFLLTASMSAAPGSKAEGQTHSNSLSTARKAIKATIEGYRLPWLANDSKVVLRTFTDDAVVLPAPKFALS